MARLDGIKARVTRIVDSGDTSDLHVLLQQDLPWLFRMVENNPGYFGTAVADESEIEGLRAEITELQAALDAAEEQIDELQEEHSGEVPPVPEVDKFEDE